MWRLLFLVLVLFGSLAILLAVILSIGVAKVAIVNAEPEAAVVSASQPVVAPARVTTTAPAVTPLTNSSVPVVNAVPATVNAVPVQGDKPPVIAVAKPVVPGAFIPGTIVLRGADAFVHGKLLQKVSPEGDLTNWFRSADYPKWVFAPNRGKYRVLVTRANGPDSGGEYGVYLGDEKKRDPEFVTKAAPTGGWNDFQTELVGIMEFTDRRTVIVIRPIGDITKPLMSLRKIELVPIDGVADRLPDADEQAGAPTITGLTLMNAITGQPISMLTNGMTIDLGPVPISIRAETWGKVGSVQFNEHGKDAVTTESLPPLAIAGDAEGKYVPWRPETGKKTITVTPFPEAGGGGKPGKRYTAYINVKSSIPLVLRAEQAELHGGLQLEKAEESNIGFWTSKDRWIDWPINIPSSGTYNVEMVYSCENGHGGDFVIQVGDRSLEAKTISTASWKVYERTTVGEMKLSAGQTRLAIKPKTLGDGKSLMKLRQVMLTPVAGDEE